MEIETSHITTYFALVGGLVLIFIAGLHNYRTKELSINNTLVLIVGGVLCGAPAVGSLNVGSNGVSLQMNNIAKLSVEASEEMLRFQALTQQSLANFAEQIKQLEEGQKQLSILFTPTSSTGLLPEVEVPKLDFERLQLLQIDNDKVIQNLSGTAPAFQSRIDDVQRFLNIEREVRDSNSKMR